MMDKAKLKRLLEAPPLKFETTNHAIAQLQKRCNDQQELVEYLARCISTQAASIIQLRSQLNQHAGAIESVADLMGAEAEPQSMIEMPDTKLVGFDR